MESPRLLPERKRAGRKAKTQADYQRETIVKWYEQERKSIRESIAETGVGTEMRRKYEKDLRDHDSNERKELAEFDAAHVVQGRSEFVWQAAQCDTPQPKLTLESIVLRVLLSLKYEEGADDTMIRGLLDQFADLRNIEASQFGPVGQDLLLKAIKAIEEAYQNAKSDLGLDEDGTVDARRASAKVTPTADQVADVVHRPEREVAEAEEAKILAQHDGHRTAASRVKSKLDINDPRSPRYRDPNKNPPMR